MTDITLLSREIAPQTFIVIVETLEQNYDVYRRQPASWPSLLGGTSWAADTHKTHETLRAAIIDMAERCGGAPKDIAWELGEGAPQF